MLVKKRVAREHFLMWRLRGDIAGTVSGSEGNHNSLSRCVLKFAGESAVTAVELSKLSK
jgi:hypothetical protein